MVSSIGKMDLRVCPYLLDNPLPGIRLGNTLIRGLRFVFLTPVLPVAPPLMMGLMETSTASMEELLGESQGHARALPAALAPLVQTVLPVQQAIVDHLLMVALLILVKPHQPLLTMGLMVTSTVSMGGTSAGLLASAPALLATWVLEGVAVKALHIMWSI
jgi:hypothetical protein